MSDPLLVMHMVGGMLLDLASGFNLCWFELSLTFTSSLGYDCNYYEQVVLCVLTERVIYYLLVDSAASLYNSKTNYQRTTLAT